MFERKTIPEVFKASTTTSSNFLSIETNSNSDTYIDLGATNNPFFVFILPIILGTFTSIILYISKSFFSDTILPRYRQIKFQGYKIDGSWESKFEHRSVEESSGNQKIFCQEFISIRQVVNDIYGDIFYHEIDDSSKAIINKKHFEFRGEFIEGVLSATYWNTNQREKGQGTFCLRSVDANTLKGKYSWLEPDSYEITADEYKWTRTNMSGQ